MLRSCWTLFICLWLLFSGALATQLSAERQSSVDISVDLSQTHEVSDKLYGIFFEEVSCVLEAPSAEHRICIDLRNAQPCPEVASLGKAVTLVPVEKRMLKAMFQQ